MAAKYPTPESALDASIKIWEYLATSGTESKDSAYIVNGFENGDKYHCPLCQYTVDEAARLRGEFIEEDDTCCPICPVRDWGNGTNRCYVEGGAHTLWCDADTKEENMVAARNLLDLIIKARNALGESNVANDANS